MNRSRLTNNLMLAGALTVAVAGPGTAFASEAPAPAAKAEVKAEVKASETTEKTEKKAEGTTVVEIAAKAIKESKDAKDAKSSVQTDVSKEQKDGCDHGATGKDCRPDPSTNGKDCLTHGKTGGVNEDHCASTPAKDDKGSDSKGRDGKTEKGSEGSKDAKGPKTDESKGSKDAKGPKTDESKGSKGNGGAHQEEADGCDHGATGKACRPDPQPEHGKECSTHGKHGGVNEDHCADTPVTPEGDEDKPGKPETKPGKPETKPGKGDDCEDLCALVEKFTPVVKPVCGPDNDVVTFPTMAGVTWSKPVWHNGTMTLTATAMGHSVFPDGASKTWTLTDANVPCETKPAPVEECDHKGPKCDHEKGDHKEHGKDCDHDKPSTPGQPDVETPAQGTPETPVTPTKPVHPGKPSMPVKPVTPGTTVVVTRPAAPVTETVVLPQGAPVETVVAPMGSPEVVAAPAYDQPMSSGAAPFFKSGIEDEQTSSWPALSLAGAGLAMAAGAVARRRRTN